MSGFEGFPLRMSLSSCFIFGTSVRVCQTKTCEIKRGTLSFHSRKSNFAYVATYKSTQQPHDSCIFDIIRNNFDNKGEKEGGREGEREREKRGTYLGTVVPTWLKLVQTNKVFQ